MRAIAFNLELVAVHEAGHAVASVLASIPFELVTNGEERIQGAGSLIAESPPVGKLASPEFKRAFAALAQGRGKRAFGWGDQGKESK
jgi:hypothetical protein